MLLEKHPHETVYVAWDNVNTHEDDAVEAVVRGAAGRLVLMYLTTYSPWLNPIEMLWRHYRREVTHCELFESVKALVEATRVSISQPVALSLRHAVLWRRALYPYIRISPMIYSHYSGISDIMIRSHTVPLLKSNTRTSICRKLVVI